MLIIKVYLCSVVETRQVPYYNIEQLVKDSKKFESMMAAISGSWGASISGNIIYCNKNKAWVEVSTQYGFDGFVLEFKNHQLKIFKIWSTTE